MSKLNDLVEDYGLPALTVFIILVFVAILVAAVVNLRESPEKEQAIYQAWCRAHKTEAITFEEWRLLRQKRLLPGQTIEADR